MKKLIFVLAAIALFAGCNDNDTPAPVPAPQQKYAVLDFESVPEDKLAGPTVYGENLYSNYTGTSPALFTDYTDPVTDLSWHVNKSDDLVGGKPEFYMGGMAASRWNDVTTAGYKNQCSVFYNPNPYGPNTGKGGHDGSATFGVVFCGMDYDTDGCPPIPTPLQFSTATTERVIESLWVMNSTYTALTVLNGGAPAKPLEPAKGWLLLTIEGIDAADKSTGKVEFYLADYRTPTSKRLVTEWTKIDLTSLGAVNKITFAVTSSDVDPTYGSNQPNYVCVDDVTVRI